MTKKHILITGSTDGIGKLLVYRLAKDGHHLYLHGRNQEKLKNLKDELLRINDQIEIQLLVIDLSNLSEIENLVSDFLTKVKQLDVIVNNAGVYKSAKPLNADGLDMRYAVNFLAPVIMTYPLISLLKNSSDPRIINLSSAAQAPVDLHVLRGDRSDSERSTYAQSKLALTMWTMALSEEFKDTTVTAVNPGSLLNTRMVSEAFGHHWSPAEKGSDLLYELSVGEKYKGVTGKYFDNDRGSFGPAHPDANDQDKIKKLMDETRKILDRIN